MGRGNVSFPNIPTPKKTYLSVFPAYQCNTRQVVVKTVISASEFHVSGQKLHLTKRRWGLRCKAP